MSKFIVDIAPGKALWLGSRLPIWLHRSFHYVIPSLPEEVARKMDDLIS